MTQLYCNKSTRHSLGFICSCSLLQLSQAGAIRKILGTRNHSFRLSTFNNLPFMLMQAALGSAQSHRLPTSQARARQSCCISQGGCPASDRGRRHQRHCSALDQEWPLATASHVVSRNGQFVNCCIDGYKLTLAASLPSYDLAFVCGELL